MIVSDIENFAKNKEVKITFANAQNTKKLKASKVYVMKNGKEIKHINVSIAKTGNEITVKATKTLEAGNYTIFINNGNGNSETDNTTFPVAVNITVE
ncbi:hypothetical protein [Paenisporosarcina indica]|uniref:hypothetical protein n=1 Tax=Paenisporosarcina indica TaxID=650093 RepID=UPI00094FBCF3|nr:hypothetical protein [Paenisporosarcina indica]